ncbi:TPA: helix-turn-helix domain-containing protein [Raoultella planticola]
MANKERYCAYNITALRTCAINLTRPSLDTNVELANTLMRQLPEDERLVAIALNVHPFEIWPSRYSDLTRARNPKKVLAPPGQGLPLPSAV